jgi:hypothetical protein
VRAIRPQQRFVDSEQLAVVVEKRRANSQQRRTDSDLQLFGRNGIRRDRRGHLLDAAHFTRELLEPAGAAATQASGT